MAMKRVFEEGLDEVVTTYSETFRVCRLANEERGIGGPVNAIHDSQSPHNTHLFIFPFYTYIYILPHTFQSC